MITQFRSNSERILNGEAVILDISAIENQADYGGMLYELKKLEIQEGQEYQIDNAGDLLMYRSAYKRYKRILEKF